MAHAFLLNPALLAAIELKTLDWVIIIASILVCFVPALFVGKKSGESTSEFFASGRSVPWWLAGLSMVATTFSSDTPNWVTEQVRKFGVAGNWQWWAFVLTGVSTVFFFARLWRRSGVMTDLEFYELRYSGKAASVVRGFRAVYLGLFFNCFIMGMVTLAACKIANILFDMPYWQTIVICGVLNVVFAAHSGLWGVLIIDMVQFFIKMTAVFAAAYFSLREVAKRTGVGETAFAGLQELVSTLSKQQVVMPAEAGAQPVMSAIDGSGQPILNILPNFDMWSLALMIFIVPIAIGWWANWYPGAEPGGGSYIAQRMLASKSEKDSLGGTLFFNIAHYVLRPWPWIITALCSIIIYPDLASIKAAFPTADQGLIGHDSAFPAMLKFLPVGFMGLMVGGLIAANSSTILTHLNWGASYLVHDFYRRFINPTGSEKHYVGVGRICTLLLYVIAALLSTVMSSAQEAFQILLQIGAGTGLLYMLRWFWWRINAWCEIVAMISSFLIAVGFFIAKKNGLEMGFAKEIIIGVSLTSVTWLVAAFVAPQTDRATLLSFFKKVQPAGPGWDAIRREAGVPESTVKESGDHMGLATLGWVSGCTVIWSSLFAIGKFLYGEMTMAWILTGVFVVSGIVLLQVIRKLWT
ncbi:sodium:solute symporter family protein [Haloferula sp. BvORR071]|uniref:sodium:solute symporter family protein n=1 Tax=Haloferula sp. BvORR071 TaxID=1396141 RepID=UPI000AFFAA7B|nr:sodium:solute symporter family protein [Haloferula sp. BvORR071]